ncbi:zinc finger protein 467 [Gaeumannomyces tritici R3-111a-1]|uniref:Zinc finger protein 467 n=1 Tax=Gaeumannomyces tritici (strain R3-111a-1) TaxID=644352 RepID=J3P7D7_GAET3|nr:zinc finger protein 467 [Gaeumannomyces tritici R3-111a-1]EJT72568.1 zinc finger protein 467 [Gaeumannomyces tritici R3-111a-1]
MKRRNEEEHPSSRPKRRLTVAKHVNAAEYDGNESDSHDDGDVQSSAASYVDSGSESDGEVDDDDQSTPATTITRAGDTKSGPPSTSTAVSRKVFPSMLKTIKCTHPGCPKTFNRPARLAAHLRSHMGDRALKCPHEGCDKAYFNEKHLKQHIKGSHTGERQYACPEPGCDKTFLTGTRLRRHAVVHSGQGRFPCTGHGPCDKVFRKHQTLQRHVRADHLGQPAFACSHDNCGAGFDTANTLRKHVQREHGELRFWCDECGKEDGEGGRRTGFTTMHLLMVHMRRCHVDCLFCDARCGSQWELERHIEMHHSGSSAADRKVVACTWDGCDKKFTRRANLNVHVRMVHEGYRFVCGDVAFPDSPELVAAGWGGEGDGDDDGDGNTRGNGAACGSGFHTKRRLEDHIRVAHLNLPRLAKTLHENENDGDAGLKPAGLFSMYASTATAGWDEDDDGLLFAAASQQITPHPTAVSLEQQVAASTDLFCSQSDCFQAFNTIEERDEHVKQLHSSRDGYAGHAVPILPAAWEENPPVEVRFLPPAENASPYLPAALSDFNSTKDHAYLQTAVEGQNLLNPGMPDGESTYDITYRPISRADDLSALVDPRLLT